MITESNQTERLLFDQMNQQIKIDIIEDVYIFFYTTTMFFICIVCLRWLVVEPR